MQGEQTPTTITQPLILELIKTISENTNELHKLRSQVEQLSREKRELIRDVACMSRGIEAFRAEFEPYLKRAVESEATWKNWRKNWVQLVGGALILGFLMWIGTAALHHAAEWWAALVSARGPKE